MPKRAGVKLKKPNPYANIRPSPLTKQLVSGIVAMGEEGDTGRMYPSPSNAESCSRHIAYMASGIPPSNPRPPETILAAEQGKAEEPIVERLLEMTGYRIVGRQVSVSGELINCPSGGTIDMIVSKQADDDVEGVSSPMLYVEDTKRLGLFRYLGLVKEGVRLAFPEYYTQLQLYMRASGIPRALLVAIPADYSAIKWYWKMRGYSQDSMPPPVWVCEIDENVAWQDSRIKQNAKMIAWIDQLEPHEVPRKFDPYNDRWPCDYCSHQPDCKKAG